MASFIRLFFNSTFKTNPYLERAIMTDITRVSKESMFSDLNNLRIVLTTSEMYENYFGFTEKEVFEALDEAGLSDKKEDEKNLKNTVAAAHRQIEEKKYDEEILQFGVEKERIKHYGFAFEGKRVLIG